MFGIDEAIKKISCGKNLAEKEAEAVFGRIMSGKVPPERLAAFLVALNAKGETVSEITGASRAMRKKAVKVSLHLGRRVVIDTCGTGGTRKNTFNISTAAAFVVAACGVAVAKHGNRASSGRVGSADCLEELGVRIDAPPAVAKKCVEKIGIGFFFAPLYHSAMRHAAPVRKRLGVKTIFNLLGPLSNPASASRQVVGVYDASLTEKIASVLRSLGSTAAAFVVHGEDGFDEVSISARTKVSELKGGRIRTYYVSPRDFGLKRSPAKALLGGPARKNASIIKSILSGRDKGPRRDVVLANSSLALVLAGRAHSFREGVHRSFGAIKDGRALAKLGALVKMTNENGK